MCGFIVIPFSKNLKKGVIFYSGWGNIHFEISCAVLSLFSYKTEGFICFTFFKLNTCFIAIIH